MTDTSTGTEFIQTAQEYYAATGFLVIISNLSLPVGPIDNSKNTWRQPGFSDYCWTVISTATREEMRAQESVLGNDPYYSPSTYFLYCIIALD